MIHGLIPYVLELIVYQKDHIEKSTVVPFYPQTSYSAIS